MRDARFGGLVFLADLRCCLMRLNNNYVRVLDILVDIGVIFLIRFSDARRVGLPGRLYGGFSLIHVVYVHELVL